MIPVIFISNFYTALAYFIAGQAGLLLAIPPSNAAAVWPAAGVALAAILISGNRVLPGILVGAILAQTSSYLDADSIEKILSSLSIGSVVATGAVIQAWVGAKLVRRIFFQDKALLKERSIILFCLLAGPVSCLTSASVGITTLWYEGILTSADLALAWSTWWIGDSIGVLVFTPVMLCLFARPRHLWKQRITSVAMPLCILASIAFIAFEFSYRQEMSHVENEFEKNTLQFKNELINRVNIHLESSEDLKNYFDSSGVVSSEEFPRYVRPKLYRYPEILALEWIPLVHHRDREAFEDRIGAEIKVADGKGGRERSPVKDFYYPIEYLEPYIGNENALGFDIRSNPKAVVAVESACSTGKTAVTSGLKLVQETEEQIAVVFYAPVYQKAPTSGEALNCEFLSGLAASVFRLENAIKNIPEKFPELKLSVLLRNDTELLYSDVAAADESHNIPNQFQFTRTYKIAVANQNWEVTFSPGTGFISHYSSWSIWLIIVGGLLIAAISGIGLLMLTGRALQTEEKIQQRTAELNLEIKERKNIATLLAVENKCLEMITHNVSIHEVLDSITTLIEDLIPDTLSSILLLDASGEHLVHGSAPSLPADYTRAIDGVAIGPRVGSCGTAAYLNKQIVVSDIETDPLWSDFKELALGHGLRACWSTPITVENGTKVLGTFALYFKTPKEPDSQSMDLVHRMANIAAITIMRKQSEDQLTFHASHDALTGLVNRREFERRATRLLEAVKRNKEEHALCFMDLDQFKVVNDNCGHPAGDEMLRQITSALQQVVRKSDTLSRMGGDEFSVLMEYCSLEHAYRVATSLHKVIEDFQFLWEGKSFKVGVSIGLVAITEAIPSLTELLKEADAACYMAKELGRNRIHVYNPEDIEIAHRRGEMQWVTRIGQALEEDRFLLYAQAITPLNGDSEEHYELLIRMIDETGELIPPGAFLPAAERYNLIAKIDLWVIKQAFAILVENPAFVQRVNFISINLSGQSLADPNVLDLIKNRLQESGIEGEKVCFEITETAAISNMSMAKQFISTLKQLGCWFALDDFGSGLSSFGYLKNLPVDYLKIDGMFVKDIIDDPIDHAMVKSINEIGQIMGMQTIAEFVENDAIKEKVREIGVNYAQGYGIAKPVLLADLLHSD